MSDSDYEINPDAGNRLMALYEKYGPRGSFAMQERGLTLRPHVGPELSDFLGKGVPQALMGFGARMAPAAEVVPIPSSTLRAQVGIRGNARNPYPDKLNQYLDWESGVENGQFTKAGQYETYMEPANETHPLTSPPPKNPGLLERMAADIQKQSQAEFADKWGGRLDQAMRNGGEAPTVKLGPISDADKAAFLAQHLAEKPPGPLGYDKGATGGTAPKDVPYLPEHSAASLLMNWRSAIKAARGSNVVPFGVRKPANDTPPKD